MPISSMNASSAGGSISSKFTPMTIASWSLWRSWKRMSSGISTMHGPHQVAQKLTTTHLPR